MINQIEKLKAEVTRQQATIVRQKKLISAQNRLIKIHVNLFKTMYRTLDNRAGSLTKEMARIDQLISP
jgi:tmRNA-binding protein